MPKCELFDLLDFRYSYTTKPICLGDLGTKINKKIAPSPSPDPCSLLASASIEDERGIEENAVIAYIYPPFFQP
jgi:hypothetical protein